MFLSVRSFASMKEAQSADSNATLTSTSINEVECIDLVDDDDDEISHFPSQGNAATSDLKMEPKVEPGEPRRLGKRVPVRLVERLRKTREPVVGLDFVSETIACSIPEAEPFYQCRLCGSQGRAKRMFKHLLRKGHRVKFLQRMHPGDPRYLSLDHKERMSELNYWRENDHLDRIQTIYSSDELYPWRPAEEDNAGAGEIAPSEVNAEVPAERSMGRRRRRGLVGVLQLKEDGVEDVRNCQQLDHYYQLAGAVLDRMSEFHVGHCSARGREELKTWYAVVRTSLQTMRNIAASDVAEASVSLSPLSQSSFSLPAAGCKRVEWTSSSVEASIGGHQDDWRYGKRSRFSEP